MKILTRAFLTSIAVIGLGACETINEDRFASVACNDLKQLMAAENLAALSQTPETGLYRTRNDRENRDALNVLDMSDKDRKRQAELRAAYRNNCK